MSDRYEGFVAKINTKDGRGKRGPWTLYTGKIEKADGTEYPDWVSFGFDAPPFKEGDYIAFDVEVEGDRVKAVKGTFKKPKNPPQRQRKGGGGGQQAASGGGQKKASGGSYSSSGGGKFDGTGIQNRTNPVDAQRMGLTASRTAALEAVSILLANGALPLTKAGTKAGEAARYEEITKALDKLTVRFYQDVVTGRLLETVADEGKVKPPQANDLPDGDDPQDDAADDGAADAGDDTATGEEPDDDAIPY